MNIYVTLADMVALYGQEEMDGLAKGVGDVQVVIDGANAEVDSYVRRVEKRPLPEIPLALKQSAADIARFRLYTNTESPLYLARYKAAVAYLQSVANGTVLLPITQETEPEQEAGTWASVDVAPRFSDQMWMW